MSFNRLVVTCRIKMRITRYYSTILIFDWYFLFYDNYFLYSIFTTVVDSFKFCVMVFGSRVGR